MMLPFSRHLDAARSSTTAWTSWRTSASRPSELLGLEQELIDRADLVFTGGYSLYEAKQDRHDSVHCFPSSVDRDHFAQGAQRELPQPADQAELPHPRLGFYGVIDERFDIELLRQDRRHAARLVARDGRPGGEDRPRPTCRARPNIHYLGGKTYAELPRLPVRLGRRADAVRDERVDAVHQPDQDAGISRGRQAGGLDADQGRRPPLRRAGGRADRRQTRTASSPPASGRWRCARRAATGWPRPTCCLSATSWDTTQARMAGLIAEVLGERTEAGGAGAAGGGGMSGLLAPSRAPASATTIWSSAPASPARCWPSGWRASTARACWSIDRRDTSPATPMTRRTRPAS